MTFERPPRWKFDRAHLLSGFGGVANVPILSIGAPFWAVLIGLAVSWAFERADFKRLEASPPTA